MSLVRLEIESINYSHSQSGAYALVLSVADSDQKLPIVIGSVEAQSIAIALQNNVRHPRPLTHDLMKSLADSYDIVLKQVIIYKFTEGIFYSSLITEREGKEIIIDSRTSDAIAMAVRCEAPVFTYKDIVEKAGYAMNVEQGSSKEREEHDTLVEEILSDVNTPSPHDYSRLSLSELQEKLATAVAEENYELAAQLRDELSKRS